MYKSEIINAVYVTYHLKHPFREVEHLYLFAILVSNSINLLVGLRFLYRNERAL